MLCCSSDAQNSSTEQIDPRPMTIIVVCGAPGPALTMWLVTVWLMAIRHCTFVGKNLPGSTSTIRLLLLDACKVRREKTGILHYDLHQNRDMENHL